MAEKSQYADMSLENAARAEAVQRWASDYLTSGSNSRRQRDFVAGASWLAEYLLSDEAVERVWEALELEEAGHYTRGNVRAALSAALGTKSHTNGSEA